MRVPQVSDDPKTLSEVIALTVNVTCRLCGWTTKYPIGKHELAAADGAHHFIEAHPDVTLGKP